MFGFFKKKSIDPREELRRVVGDHELPTFSGVVLQTLERLRDPDSPPSAIAEVLSADPGLSVQVLKTVNSAAYSLRRKVSSLDQAIALLGVAAVESMVLSVAVGSSLPRDPVQGYDSRRFWRTAARRATTARALAARLHPATAAESFTASLLQDMAVPVLATERSESYGPLLEHWHNSTEDLAVLEQAEFGWNHAEVGTWMCAEWVLPEPLAISIGAHHGAVSTASEGLICPPAVALVSHIHESDEHDGRERIIEAVRADYGLAPDSVVQLLDDSFDAAEEIAKLFS